MGSKGGGTSTSTTSSAPPPEVMANYKDVTAQAKQVAAAPLQQYQGNIVAGFTPQQQAAFGNINAAQGAYQPYFNSSQNLINQGTQGYTPTQFSQGAVQQYESPYTQDVINSTMANINQNNAEQQSSLQGNAIAKGAWGGDRADLARNDLARQQNLASQQTIAGLENQNYSQALGQFNQQNQTGLQSAALGAQTSLQGAGLQGAMGNYAQANQLGEAQAQLSAGTLQQQLSQAQLNVPYQQFLQAQQYPFQTTQWLSGIDTGLGSQMGGTSSTTQPNQSGGNTFSQVLGAGLGIAGLFFKDGGSIDGYAPGGGITQNSEFGIPDVSMSFIPAAGQSNPMSSSLPPPPVIQQPAKQDDGMASVMSGLGGLKGSLSDISPMKGIKAFGSGLMNGSGLNESTGYGLNAAGFGNAAYSMLDFAKGGIVPEKFASGGWQQQPLFDKPMFASPASLSAEEMGILPSGGSVGGLPLNPTMNNRLAMDMMRDPSMGTQGPQSQQAAATMDGTNSFGGNFNMNPYAGFKDPVTAPAAAATPSDMQALLAAQQQPSGGMSTIPQGPQVAQAQTGVASDAQQGLVDPNSLDDLKSQLAKNAPSLDKGTALATAGFAMMAGKNRNAMQNIGEGGLAGLENYGKQKASVREYALKQAEVEKQAQQLAMEAARYNKQLAIEQENADTNKQYKDITAKVAQDNLGLKDVVKIKDALGTEHLVKKSDLINAQKDGSVAGAQNADGTFSTIPDKASEAWKENGLSPTSPPINKFQAKALSQHYDDAVKADQGARDASVMVDKIYPALQNYSGGMGSEFRSNAMAAASSLFNAKAPDFTTNAQEINKVSGTIATQLASQMPSGSRVGIGVDNLFKSTTISPTNTPEANMWIAKNIKDAPAVTAQVVGIKSYLAENNISPAHANAIEQKFYKENPIMVPSGAGKGIDRVNPKFKDPSFFYKWISGKEGSSGAALDKSDPRVQKALDAGYTEDQIRQHLGQ